MTEPEFTADERYILAYYASETGSGASLVWIIHSLMVALFAYGLYTGQTAILFSAFGVVIIWRIYEQSFQSRFARATRSAFAKYQAALESRVVRVLTINTPKAVDPDSGRRGTLRTTDLSDLPHASSERDRGRPSLE